MKIRRISLFLCLALVFSILCACTQTPEEPHGKDEPEMISAEMLSGYRITRSDFAAGAERAVSLDLRKTITDLTGTEPPIGTDWDNGEEIPEKEILVGKTTRPESAAFAERFAASGADCAYGVLNGKILLYAKDTENLQRIAEKFVSDAFGRQTCICSEEAVPVLREGCFAGYTCEDRLLLEDGSEPHSSLRSDILWGVNGHNKAHAPYGEENTEDILRLAAEMGSTVYRINYNPTTPEMVAYITDLIDRCHAYGMKVVLAMDNKSGTPEEISERMTYIAEQMRGKADYFQLFNETDIWCAQNDDGTFYNAKDWTGTKDDYYNPARVPIAVEKMRAAITAFRAAAPEAKLIVNVGACHFPMFDRYVEAGLSWDIIAFDFYEVNYFDPHTFLHDMEKRYPGYDIMIAECNYPANNGRYTEEEQAAWLKSFFETMNTYDSGRLIGVQVYELMDEIRMQSDDQWYGEAHFGIVNTDPNGKPGAVKEGYRTLQTMLCGGKAEFRTVYTPVSQQ